MTDIKDNLTIKIKNGITVKELRDTMNKLTSDLDECIVEQDLLEPIYYPFQQADWSKWNPDITYTTSQDEDK